VCFHILIIPALKLTKIKNKETNSRGCNTTIHVYEGVTFQEIDDTVEKALCAHSNIQDKIENKKSYCQKCGEWLEDGSICGVYLS
jgi:hypothetical protein